MAKIILSTGRKGENNMRYVIAILLLALGLGAIGHYYPGWKQVTDIAVLVIALAVVFLGIVQATVSKYREDDGWRASLIILVAVMFFVTYRIF